MKKLLLLAMVIGLLIAGLVTASTVWMKDGKEASLTEVRREITSCRQEGFSKKVSNINQFVQECMAAKGYTQEEKK
jgi:hypothetical protein